MKNHHKTIYAFIIVIIILVLGAFASGVRGSALDSVSGYAWGADDWVDVNNNGIQDPWVDLNNNGTQDPGEEDAEHMSPIGGMEWLNFNCINDGNCGSSDFGLNVDPVTGDITGYAWSSNYGWMKFGGLTGFPTGPGTTSANAKLDLNTNEVSGWARFCTVAANPTTCIGFVSSLSNGGWDGWVSLRGTSPNYGVSLSGTELSGYAWGANWIDLNNNSIKDPGEIVGVGWISFNCISGGNCGDSDYKVIHDPITDPVVTIQASPINVPVGGTTTISWDGLGLVDSPTGCTATGGVGGWAGARPSPSGSYPTTTLSAGTYVFSLSCEGEGGGVALGEVTVNVGIQLDFYAEPNIAYPPAYEVTLHWNAVPSDGVLTSCVPTSSPAVPEWDNLTINNMPPGGSVMNIPVPLSPTQFTLTCSDGVNDVTKDVYVNRGTLPESIAFSNTAVVENPVGSGDYFTNLTWTTINMVEDSCVATNDGGVGEWDSNKFNPESGPTSQLDVPVPAIAPAFTTYTITCTGLYSGNPVAVSLFLNENSGSGFNKKIAPKYIER